MSRPTIRMEGSIIRSIPSRMQASTILRCTPCRTEWMGLTVFTSMALAEFSQLKAMRVRIIGSMLFSPKAVLPAHGNRWLAFAVHADVRQLELCGSAGHNARQKKPLRRAALRGALHNHRWIFRRLAAANPSIPVPSSKMLEGSGTEGVREESEASIRPVLPVVLMTSAAKGEPPVLKL